MISTFKYNYIFHRYLPFIIYMMTIYRISNALKQSENFTRPFAQSGDMTINRKSVIRMQSKSCYKLYCIHANIFP